MITIDEQIELFKTIGKQLKTKLECFVIGGSAMLFYGVKSATKDVDIVFLNDAERAKFVNILKKMGFGNSMESIFRYEELAKNKPILMETRDSRFDLFSQEIISTMLSPGIIDRSREKHEFSNLIANIVSLEDIILLKCATERAADRKDAADIINSKEVNWDTIIKEAVWQTEHGKKFFNIFLFDFVMELKEEHKVGIPKEVIKKITKIYEDQMLQFIRNKKLTGSYIRKH